MLRLLLWLKERWLDVTLGALHPPGGTDGRQPGSTIAPAPTKTWECRARMAPMQVGPHSGAV
jgi:hypothetical protein